MKYLKTAVCDIVRRFAGRGESGKERHTPGSDRVTFLAGLKPAYPDTSMSKLTLAQNVRTSRGINHDLEYKSYKLSIKHFQTQVIKIARASRGKRLVRSGSPTTFTRSSGGLRYGLSTH